MVSRQLINSKIWHKPPHYVKIWIYLLLKANHADRRSGQKLNRGQCLVALRELCDAISYCRGYALRRPTKDSAWRALEWLREERMIATARTTRGLVITIVNYCRYQNPVNYERDGHREEAAASTRRAREPIDKKGKKEKNTYARAADRLIRLYGEKVKPPSEDHSRTQAKKNATKLMQKEGYSFDDLAAAVMNYAAFSDSRGRGSEFRKNAGNFFGRERVFEEFLPGTYRKDAPTDTDTKAIRDGEQLEELL